MRHNKVHHAAQYGYRLLRPDCTLRVQKLINNIIASFEIDISSVRR
jgi:hypothetical protein